MKYVFFIFLIYLSCTQLFAQQGYKIDVTINGLTDTTIILGYYKGDAVYPVDTIKLNSKGKGIFQKKKVLVQGMYIILPPDSKAFNFILGKDQDFSLQTDTSDYNGNLKFSGTPDNKLLMDYNKYLGEKFTEVSKLREIIKSSDSDEEKQKSIESINQINEERINKAMEICTNNPDLFASTFIKAGIEISVPEELQQDKKKSFYYYKNHYFDNFDLSDVRLMHTPFFENKIINYLDKIVIPEPDSIILAVDYIMGKAESDSSLFQFVLNKLISKYNTSKIMGMETVMVHLAEKYFIPKAWWAKEDKIEEFKERVDVMKPLLLGKIAPDIQLRYIPADHFKAAMTDTALKRYPHAGEFFNLSAIKSKYTILLFWEASCSHCKEQVPQVYKIYEEKLKDLGVQVIAVSALGGVEGKETWIDFINKNQLYTWINAWNPYDYKYKQIYDLRTYPQLYLLNSNKEIIGKEIMVENIADFILYYEKRQNSIAE